MYKNVSTPPNPTIYKSKVSIPHSKITDLPEVQNLFLGTISTNCKKDYSPEQIIAWTSSIKNTQRWTDKLTSQYFLIAELDNKIVGFASLENNYYLDFLYVHKDHQRQGVADILYSEIEKEAIKRGGTVLNSDVSETAKIFFLKIGFKTISPQKKVINEVKILNYKMAKQLDFNDKHYTSK